MLVADSIVALRGRLSARDDGVTMHAYGVKPIDAGARDESGTLTLSLAEQRATEALTRELRETLERHPGESEVRLQLSTPNALRVFELPVTVRVTPELYGELKALLGPRCLADA